MKIAGKKHRPIRLGPLAGIFRGGKDPRPGIGKWNETHSKQQALAACGHTAFTQNGRPVWNRYIIAGLRPNPSGFMVSSSEDAKRQREPATQAETASCVYFDRTFGGYRHRRHPRRPIAAGTKQCQGEG